MKGWIYFARSNTDGPIKIGKSVLEREVMLDGTRGDDGQLVVKRREP